ncbi:MAG TPA: sulfatase-like hydrolase/transferase [Byssovorax sp.]
MKQLGRGLAAAATIAIAGACSGRGDGPEPVASAAPSASPSVVVARAPVARVLTDFLAALPTCDVGHGGLVVDAGTPALAAHAAWSGALPQRLADVEHDGSTWSRARDRRLELLVATPERTQLFVAARGEGFASKSAQVTLDDQPLGTLNFAREQIRVATTGTTTLPVDAGLHVVGIRFSGKAKDDAAFADLDWIRFGVPDDPRDKGDDDKPDEVYGAPTLHDIVAPAAVLGGVPHKSLALRAPGFVRCALRLTPKARLRGFVGVSGDGAADAEVRVRVDGKPPIVLQTFHVESSAGKWVEVDRALGDLGRGVGYVELAATRATKGARVLFGDPSVVVPASDAPTAAAPAVPAARAVVVVVLDGVERSELPPWNTGPAPLPNLADLALTAATFERHRAPTTIVPAVVASMLTGLSPRGHGLVDGGARLPATVITIGGVARDASVRTAMFTGVPSTFRAFGFAEAWEKFVEYAPSSGDPATAPIDAAAQWLTEVAKAPNDPRMIAVVHARGGHPPWDVRESQALPPKDYTGLIDARRGGQILAHMRKRKARETLSEADRTRIRALEQTALGGQDRALGALVAALKTANLWDQTLLIVTGDVSTGASDANLFAEGLELKEQLLTLPLYVHFPGGAFAGRRVDEPTEAMDIARTALGALRLSFARPSFGHDLADVAAEPGAAGQGPQIATLGEAYSARWGFTVLAGRFPRAPALCDLSLDAACAFDRRDLMPLTAFAIFQRLVEEDARWRAAARAREPATLDNDTQAALNVWGAD